MFGKLKNDKKDALCSKHEIITTSLVAKPCPECGKFFIDYVFNRCSKCAKKSNKCQLCDGPLS